MHSWLKAVGVFLLWFLIVAVVLTGAYDILSIAAQRSPDPNVGGALLGWGVVVGGWKAYRYRKAGRGGW